MKGTLTKFKQFFIENKFVLGLLIFLLVALDIYVLTKIAFIFDPLMVILKTVAAPIILAGISYYLFNPIIDWLEKKVEARLGNCLVILSNYRFNHSII